MKRQRSPESFLPLKPHWFHVLLSLALVALVLMHSGRDTGLGGMGFTPASQGGTHIVERNLTRLTVVVAILFVANCVALFHALK